MSLYSPLYQKILPFIGRCIFFLLLFINFTCLPLFTGLRGDFPLLSGLLPAFFALLLVCCVRRPSKFGFFCIFTLCIIYIGYDLAAIFFHLTGRTQLWLRIRLGGFLPFLLLAVYLAAGYIHAGHIRITEYRLTTEKPLPGGHLRIVQLSDIHPGTNLTKSAIPKIRTAAESLRPDMLMLTGDIFDENTRPDAFDAWCRLLTSLPSRYGTWYVFGNHDTDWHWKIPGHTKADIESRFSEGGIRILEDEGDTVFPCGIPVSVAGRKDFTMSGGKRLSVRELTENLPGYLILLDHQPTEFREAAQAGADLLLSGHTHGGQIFPLGWFSHRILRINAWNYGMKRLSDTCTAIVTSGLGTWSYPIRTEGRTEIVCIDITNPGQPD